MAISRALYISALLGVFLEYFDYALYGFATPAIIAAFFPIEKSSVALMLSWSIFAVSFLVRPMGAVIFGHFADRFGRRQTLMVTIILMSIATTAMGLLPTYAQVGIVAPVSLLLCRLLQGVAVSTEYSGCSTYLLEFFKKRQGLTSGIVTSASGFGVFAASGLVLLFHTNWRIPFIIAGLLVGVLGFYCRRQLAESPDFLAAQARQELVAFPLLKLMRNSLKALSIGIIVAAYVGIAIIVLEVYLPSYLQVHYHISRDTALALSTYLAFLEACCAILWGLVSDYIGQRTVMVVGGLLMAIGIFPMLHLFYIHSPLVWVMSVSYLAITMGALDGVIAAFLVNQFSTATRYTGVSLCYNLGAALFGGISPALLVFTQSHFSIVTPALYLLMSALVLLSVLVITRAR